MRTLLIAAVALLMLAPGVAAAPGPDTGTLHTDVYVPNFEECLWKGSWKAVVDTPIVTVWKYSCDGPGS